MPDARRDTLRQANLQMAPKRLGPDPRLCPQMRGLNIITT